MKYNYNIEFFKKQSRDLAYFLGFIMADGYVSNGCVRISINSKDNEILEHFKQLICPEINIGQYINICSLSKYDTKCYYNRLSIQNKDIYNIITNEYNILSPKTGKEHIPKELNQIYIPDFIRGVFDGDGSVTTKGGSPLVTTIVSASKIFLEKIQSFLGFGNIYPNRKIFTLNFCALNSIRFRDIIYNNNPFGLKRKKDILFSINLDDLQRKILTKSELLVISDTTKTIREISCLLGRYKSDIYKNIKKYKLRSVNICKTFNKSEINLIQEKFDQQNPTISVKNLSNLLNRSIRSIEGKVYRLKLRGKIK